MSEVNAPEKSEDDGDNEDHGAIIIDCGSWMCKVGLAGDDAPMFVFPSLVGRPQAPGATVGSEQKDAYVGDEADAKRGCLALSVPIDRGIVRSWDDMEVVWASAFYNELATNPEDHPVLLAEPILNPSACRERITQIMFEKFCAPAFFIASQPALSLYAQGRTEGLVIESGHTLTQIVPVHEGYYIPHAVSRLALAGRDLNNYLEELLKKNGYCFSGAPKLRFVVNSIKESLCFVAEDFWEELERGENLEREFYGGKWCSVYVGRERFFCPELLFRPDFGGLEETGIVDQAFHTIMECPPELRRDMFTSIVLAGGSTMFPGFGNRMRKDLSALCPLEWTVTVLTGESDGGTRSAWVGASILASIPSFQDMWIKMDEYKEEGPSVVSRKCQM